MSFGVSGDGNFQQVCDSQERESSNQANSIRRLLLNGKCYAAAAAAAASDCSGHILATMLATRGFIFVTEIK